MFIEPVNPLFSLLGLKLFRGRKEEDIIGPRRRRKGQNHQSHVGEREIDRPGGEHLLGEILACHHDENILELGHESIRNCLNNQ